RREDPRAVDEDAERAGRVVAEGRAGVAVVAADAVALAGDEAGQQLAQRWVGQRRAVGVQDERAVTLVAARRVDVRARPAAARAVARDGVAELAVGEDA